jgi:hypothetical protein
LTLQVAAHRNPKSKWTTNDFFDLDALALAVPYCDVVATDNERAHQLRTVRCGERLGTSIVSSPDDLLAILERLNAEMNGYLSPATPV